MRRFQSHTGQLGTAVWASAERRVKGSITDADAQGQFLSSIWAPFLRPDLAPCGRRAQLPSRSAVARSVPAFSSVSRPRLDGGEHGGRLEASREPRSAAVLEAPALVTGLDDVAVMSEPVEERRRHLGIEEHVRPFAEGQVGRDDD